MIPQIICVVGPTATGKTKMGVALARRFGGNYRLIAAFLGLNILITVIGGGFISWQAHLGGLIGGLAATAALILPHRQRAETNQQRFFTQLHFFRLQRFRNGTL